MSHALSDLVKSVFAPIDPLVIKKRELNAAKLELLSAQTALDYSRAIVDYNTARIARLSHDIRMDEDERRVAELAIRGTAVESQRVIANAMERTRV